MKFGYQRLLALAANELRRLKEGKAEVCQDVPEGALTDRSNSGSLVFRMSTEGPGTTTSPANTGAVLSTPILGHRLLSLSTRTDAARTTAPATSVRQTQVPTSPCLTS